MGKGERNSYPSPNPQADHEKPLQNRINANRHHKRHKSLEYLHSKGAKMYRTPVSQRRVPVTISLPFALVERLDQRLRSTSGTSEGTDNRSQFLRRLIERELTDDERKTA